MLSDLLDVLNLTDDKNNYSVYKIQNNTYMKTVKCIHAYEHFLHTNV